MTQPQSLLREHDLQQAADLIKKARKVVFFSGAGMSADSGVGTFRGSGSGFWNGLTGPLLLLYFGTPWGWRFTPGYAWRMYLKEFYGPIARAAPHDGHHAIVRLEKALFTDNTPPIPSSSSPSVAAACGRSRLEVVTMNVDGYHQKAGNTQVAELHGTVMRNRCVEHGLLRLDENTSTTELLAARCPQCGRCPRPDVVLFTEALPGEEFYKAQRAVAGLERGRDVMVVVGTTGQVYPAASLPEAAIARGVKTIEVDVFLRGRAKDVLTRLIDMVLNDDKDE